MWWTYDGRSVTVAAPFAQVIDFDAGEGEGDGAPPASTNGSSLGVDRRRRAFVVRYEAN